MLDELPLRFAAKLRLASLDLQVQHDATARHKARLRARHEMRHGHQTRPRSLFTALARRTSGQSSQPSTRHALWARTASCVLEVSGPRHSVTPQAPLVIQDSTH